MAILPLCMCQVFENQNNSKIGLIYDKIIYDLLYKIDYHLEK